MWKVGTANSAQFKKDNNGLIVVAVDADKSSQHALKWAADHLISKGHIFHLLHIRKKITTFATPTGQQLRIDNVNEEVAAAFFHQLDMQTKELLLPFQCFCSRRGLQCKEVIVDDSEVPKAIIDYLVHHSVDKLVLGTSNRNAFTRTFKQADVPTSVSKVAPDFCSIYVIAKGKISSIRPAPNPNKRPIASQPSQKFEANENQYQSVKSEPIPRLPQPVEETIEPRNGLRQGGVPKAYDGKMNERVNMRMSQGGQEYNDFLYKSVNSCPSPTRNNNDRPFGYLVNDRGDGASRWMRGSNGQDEQCHHDEQRNFESMKSGSTYLSNGSGSSTYESYTRFTPPLPQSYGNSYSPPISQEAVGSSRPSMEEMSAQMMRLKLETQQAREMYDNVLMEAVNVKKKAADLASKKAEEERRFSRGAIDQMPDQWIRNREALQAESMQKMDVATKNNRGNKTMTRENQKVYDDFNATVRYRRYTVEEIQMATDNFSDALKIGEGGYGPVFESTLDHTLVAIKILHSDVAQGMRQFHQEVEVLSSIRHPNMVLLMGACPDNGALVYEFMSNGSLEDRLFRRDNTPTLSWKLRFKIATEIATGLLFLHQNKPEPLVHRDLKPGNILLDHNFVSKIADVGLARLIPPSVADSVTQYRMTAAAGTFCYIDPEYQKTGMLGIKSDVYALGIILLQLITGKPPMGLAHNMEDAIEMDRIEDMLDPSVPDWPLEETIQFAKLSLKCAELRHKDRPDLGSDILPELNRLRAVASAAMYSNNRVGVSTNMGQGRNNKGGRGKGSKSGLNSSRSDNGRSCTHCGNINHSIKRYKKIHGVLDWVTQIKSPQLVKKKMGENLSNTQMDCKWGFTVKQNLDDFVVRLKAQLLARGYSQCYEVDYEETFSHVAKFNSVLLLLSLATNSQWSVNQLDVKNAFLKW
ncbi:U-box domain-containing protein 35-like [Aristolochia californica]|uniref:U-box domain-containing protein 35-like n=1 Tax=Aristolochia californica TaxID=171875 RepID=UPI0035DA322C